VKTRLIVHEDADWVLPSSGDIGPSPEPSKEHPCLWPVGQEIPDGWDEIGVVEPGLELCSCGHGRRSHIQHGNRCLESCECLRFREPGCVQRLHPLRKKIGGEVA
jgi:hypothetical protein